MRQLLQPGDEFIIEAPGWPQAAVMAKALKVPTHTVKRTEADGWRFPIDLHLTLDGEAFARQLLVDPYRTFLIPGSAYGEPAHIRLGVGGGELVQLDMGLERLALLLGCA